MTPERTAALVTRWVRLYTRSLPGPVAERRLGEIEADLHDHIADERARGTGERRIALAIASRMARGVAADAGWRRQHTREAAMSQTSPFRRSLIRVGIIAALILTVPLVATLAGDGEGWGVFDFVFAAVLLVAAGLLIEFAVRQPRRIVYRAVAAAIGVAAMVLGEADDAPGLVLFGLVLVVGAIGLTVRTALRSSS